MLERFGFDWGENPFDLKSQSSAKKQPASTTLLATSKTASSVVPGSSTNAGPVSARKGKRARDELTDTGESTEGSQDSKNSEDGPSDKEASKNPGGQDDDQDDAHQVDLTANQSVSRPGTNTNIKRNTPRRSKRSKATSIKEETSTSMTAASAPAAATNEALNTDSSWERKGISGAEIKERDAPNITNELSKSEYSDVKIAGKIAKEDSSLPPPLKQVPPSGGSSELEAEHKEPTQLTEKEEASAEVKSTNIHEIAGKFHEEEISEEGDSVSKMARGSDRPAASNTSITDKDNSALGKHNHTSNVDNTQHISVHVSQVTVGAGNLSQNSARAMSKSDDSNSTDGDVSVHEESDEDGKKSPRRSTRVKVEPKLLISEGVLSPPLRPKRATSAASKPKSGSGEGKRKTASNPESAKKAKKRKKQEGTRVLKRVSIDAVSHLSAVMWSIPTDCVSCRFMKKMKNRR